ncbi:MAG: hypothetical protein ABH878_03300, partial [bacterium]
GMLREAGFIISGFFLSGEPWERINLLGAPIVKAESKPRTGAPKEAKGKEQPRRTMVTWLRPWFSTVVVVVGVIFIGFMVVMKFANRKTPPPSSNFSEPLEAPIEVITPQAVDTLQASLPEGTPKTSPETEVETIPTQAETIPREAELEKPVKVVPEAEAATVSTPKSQPALQPSARNLVFTDAVLQIVKSVQSFSLITLTADRFLIQIDAAEPSALQAEISRISSLSGLKSVRSTNSEIAGGKVHGIVQGGFSIDPSAGASTKPAPVQLINLAKQHGLQNKDLVFIGKWQLLQGFLAELATVKYSIYRIVIVPWENGEYRTVIEL